MDVSGYLPMFLAEAREHLQELNLAVVHLEESPSDAETIDEIFRIAHSFKGMSATMGFAHTAALTHEMEDVLELLRRRRDGLDRAAVDVLLECVDALAAAIEAIDADGEEKLEEAPLIERLKRLVRAERDDTEADAAQPPGSADIAALAGGRRVLHAVAQLADEVMMPSVRAYMALAALAEHGEVLASIPPEDAVDAFDGRAVEAWIASEHEESAVRRTLMGIADVAAATVSEEKTSTESIAGLVEPLARGGEDTAGAEASEPEAVSTVTPARTSNTVRVDAERLDQLMHLMGELVVHRTAVESLAMGLGVPGLGKAMQDLTRTSQALQRMVMQVRMIPVEAVFLRFPRLVRDLSSKLGKQVELKLGGQDTELDRTVVDALGDPLVHLVRNALDHGLEGPEERVASGKHETGTIEISARHSGGSVVITVSDDGRGIEPERVARHAASRGLIPTAAVDTVDQQRAIELLFTPGFSTADRTSDISGRGVGMDAVRAVVQRLGGEVVIQSEPGAGTMVQVRLPLTIAIVVALLVETNGIPFAVPLDRVERTVNLADHTVRSVLGRRTLVLRDGVLPLLDLGESLGYDEATGAAHAVILRGNDRRIAVAVTSLIGQRELVTRPLPPSLAQSAAISGGAVLADGDIALIVDTDAVALRAHVQVADAA